MQDRPTYQELLGAIEKFLDEEIVSNTPGSRGFHARVAANALRIIGRELEAREEQMATEWAGLDELLGSGPRPPSATEMSEALRRRNEELCERIRSGEAESGRWADAAFNHVRRTVRDKLTVSDPALLERDAD